MPRQTKIVATLGPATDAPNVLTALVAAGLDVGRINFSHGGFDDWARSARLLREAARRGGRQVAVLGDLQGPKIRVERFRRGSVRLQPGQRFVLDAGLGSEAGDEHAVGIAYKDLPRDLKPGNVLLLDDGRLELQVMELERAQVRCEVILGGELSNNKGLNLRGGGLSAAALTSKDCEDVRRAAEIGVDYLAVSFPKGEDDINEARGMLLEAGLDAGVVAKIERTEAVDNIDEIMLASDAVMVARGDLGVEIGDAELAGVQKNILRRAAECDCVVITATQMMESMVSSPVPTRAELLDVANAVLDGTDAVMLSAETAVGKYPLQVVEAMDRICLGAEKHRSRQKIVTSEQAFQRVDEAIAKAAMFTANHFRVAAIAALTESGSTAMWMSRIRTDLPIYALTTSKATARRVALYRNVHPILIGSDVEHSEALALRALEEAGAVAPGDLFLFTRGEVVGREGGTNSMKIMRAGTVQQSS